jgi:hypothetical protein
MKKLIAFTIFSFASILAFAQTQVVSTAPSPKIVTASFPELDKSPMDMAYFPIDYPKLKTQNKATPTPIMRVIYSRPQKDNRVIFGELVEYNKVWRMGANEATEIEFFKDVTIGGKKVTKGRYTLYAVPTETKWTFIVNKDTDTWGAFVYDEKKDVLRTDIPVQPLTTPVEAFSVSFTKTDKGANLNIAWENTSVAVPIEVKDSTSKL